MRVLILLSVIAVTLAQHECDENQHYDRCGTACPLRCDNYHDPPLACVKMCRPGCHCDEGYVETGLGSCVKPERCLAESLLQFYKRKSGDITTYDPYLKVAVTAETKGDCSVACLFENEFSCKGFYFCNKVCFLKSIVNSEEENVADKDYSLGQCDEYIRGQHIDTCSLPVDEGHCRGYFPRYYHNKTTGQCHKFIYGGCDGNTNNFDTLEECQESCGVVDIEDKPFNVAVELRKLDYTSEKVKRVDNALTLHDCYERCKEAGSSCLSFSFCDDSPQENKECMITSDIVIKDLTKDTQLIPDKWCNVYNPKFLDHYNAYPEIISLLPGDKEIKHTESLERCALSCRLEGNFECRGFEYCQSMKTCTLFRKHILDFRPGEFTTGLGGRCVHYAEKKMALGT